MNELTNEMLKITMMNMLWTTIYVFKGWGEKGDEMWLLDGSDILEDGAWAERQISDVRLNLKAIFGIFKIFFMSLQGITKSLVNCEGNQRFFGNFMIHLACDFSRNESQENP